MENLVLTKGQTLDFKKEDWTSYSKIRVGLSWDVATSDRAVDLDLFVVKKETKQVAYYNDKTAIKGITLWADNLTWEWDWDDEVVDMDATQSDDWTYVLCVNIYEAVNRWQSLAQVNNAKATIYDSTTNKVLATFNITENGWENTWIIIWEVKDTGDNYTFTALGNFVKWDINQIRASL